MAFESSGYKVLDPDGKMIASVAPDFSDLLHFENFIDAIRNGSALNAPISDAQVSAMLCHLGNVAYRQDASLKRDANESWANVIGQDSPWWKRQYRDGWL